MAAINGIINGTDIKIYAATNLVAYATSGTLNVNHSTRDNTNKESSGWKESGEGLRDWSIDLDGMYAWAAADGSAITNLDDLLSSYVVTRDSLAMEFGTNESGGANNTLTGTVYMTSGSISASTEESTTYSCSFEGTGALTIATA